jgi:hypothetical protein
MVHPVLDFFLSIWWVLRFLGYQPDGSRSTVMLKISVMMEEIMKFDYYNRGPIYQFYNLDN